ncbi:MAG: M48 family metalloprotease [Granulosicoccus sp.]|nr:M48 family metalloprotease [Granulosicoccus sp.]
MPDENTLAMVMAHEIAHVLHRDPIASLGGGAVSTLALLGLIGREGTELAGSILNNAGIAPRVQFTRKMEELADDQAVAAVNALYGHVSRALFCRGFRMGRAVFQGWISPWPTIN